MKSNQVKLLKEKKMGKESNDEDLRKANGGEEVWVVRRAYGNEPKKCPVQGCNADLKTLPDVNGVPRFLCKTGHKIKVSHISHYYEEETEFATCVDDWW